jgi:hypothetical protein
MSEKNHHIFRKVSCGYPKLNREFTKEAICISYAIMQPGLYKNSFKLT